MPTLHMPATHDCPIGQTVPQPPQFFGSVLRLASQPLASLPSQLPKPPLQPMSTQLPALQLPLPLVKVQGRPHMPQLGSDEVRSVSQPLPRLPSQLPKLLLQIAPH